MTDDAEQKEPERKEAERIASAYARRTSSQNLRYSESIRVEREWHYSDLLKRNNIDISTAHILEVGCGDGSEIERLIMLGAAPARCSGIELLENRFENAKRRLPEECDLRMGDACDTDHPDAAFDVVFASTVFTSILDPRVQESLATEMWRLVRPGGGVLWYDFTYDNPRNPDVRGVSKSRVHALFSEAEQPIFHRVTLAPPIGRRISWAGSFGYRLLNSLPMLRTHLVGWLPKPLQ